MEEKEQKKNVRDNLAEQFVKILESNEPLQWVKTWSSGRYSQPYNGQTDRRYNGINRMVLMLKAMELGWTDPRYYTFHQVSQMDGCKIRAGEKATAVEYWLVRDTKEKRSMTFSEYEKLLKTDPDRKEVEFYAYPKVAYVFNAAQVEGLQLLPQPERPPLEENKLAAAKEDFDVALAKDSSDYDMRIEIAKALMNKGFEVIEAVHIFDVSADKVEVVIHRESIIHSMVEYIDNTVIAEMSAPDMSLCVQYAITHPKRSPSVTPELDFKKLANLTFASPDVETFPLLGLAYKAASSSSPAACAMNGANEIAVAAFLADKISFGKMVDCVIDTTERFMSYSKANTIDELFDIDREARNYANIFITNN